MAIREVLESPLEQGADETVAYTITTTPWGTGTMSASSVSLYDVTERKWVDKSSTMLLGSISSTSTTFTSKSVTGLTPGRRYRLEFNFDIDGDTFQAFLIIEATR